MFVYKQDHWNVGYSSNGQPKIQTIQKQISPKFIYHSHHSTTIIIFNATPSLHTYYFKIINSNILHTILLVLYLQKYSHTAHSKPTQCITIITFMATQQQSPLNLCRREHLPNQDSNSQNSPQIKDEDTCTCCCCINYNFFTLGLRYALSNQNFGLGLTPQMISKYLELNGQTIKEEDVREGERQGEKSGQPIQRNAISNDRMNENKDVRCDDDANKNSPIKKESTTVIKKESKGRIEQEQVQQQNGQNIDQNNQNRILKINNLGEQSELNSSPLQNIPNEEHDNIPNDDEIPVNLKQIELTLKQVETNRLKQEQSDNSIHSSSRKDPNSQQQEHIEPNNMQAAAEGRKQQEQEPKQSDGSNSQNYSYSEDSQQADIDESAMVQKQEPYIQNRKLQQDNNAESVQPKSQQDSSPQNISYGMQFEQAKNQYRSNEFIITKSIKEQLIDKFQQNIHQHQNIQHCQHQHSRQHSQNQHSANQQPHSEPFYPYSQPQHHYNDPELMSNQHVYSLHQNFQYNHEQIQAQKSRKSRYSKKLDQELQSEQRKQHTEIEQPLNQKIQKLEYNSQSNLANPYKIYQSERQSLPLPDSNLKRQQEERDTKKERQLPEQLNLPRLFTHQNVNQLLPNYFNNIEMDADSDMEKKQEEEQMFSAALFSEDELDSPPDEVILKKQQQNQEQQDSAYAVISIQEQIKQQNFQPSTQIKKREQLDTPIENDSRRVYMDMFERLGDLSSIKKQIEENAPLQQHQQQQDIDEPIQSKIQQNDNNNSSSENEQSQLQNQPSLSQHQNKRVVSEPEKQSNNVQPIREQSQSVDQQQSSPQPISSHQNITQKQLFKQQPEQLQDLSDQDQQEEESDKQQSQQSTQKRNTVPRISKRMAIELKKQSKHQRKSEEEQPHERSSEPQKLPKLAISKTIELNINQSYTINNNLKQQEPQQQQQQQEQGRPRKRSKIQIANQFSFYQSGGSSIYSQKKSKKKKKKTEYIRKQDYDPQKYEEIQEVYYKVARKSKPKHKKKVIEEIYEVPQRKGSTKKLAREYARQKYEARRNRAVVSESSSQIQQIQEIQLSQLSQYSSNQSEIFDYPKPPPHSKRHRQKIRYVYVDQPVYQPRRKSKQSRIVDEEQLVSEESSSQLRTKKKHSYRKH